MYRNFIFALILLATLSIINSTPILHEKRGIEFRKCNGYPKNSTPPLLNVKVTPDSIEPGKNLTFDISGSVDFDIPAGTYLNIILFVPSQFGYIQAFDMDLCSDTQCPIKAGTVYSTTRKLTMPKLLPSKYTILVYELNYSSEVSVPYICANATIGS
ncbi:1737_t:CDS:1 [Acaulospora colombiana]|uniref:1737_t:CDS:1 n=1 Tax=Acaulospora colombiana TaxID=27376 RepID=A0ACA9MTE4_9GLOM|nr:1737_t:CDS:1 [Acaulospora colombiana]